MRPASRSLSILLRFPFPSTRPFRRHHHLLRSLLPTFGALLVAGVPVGPAVARSIFAAADVELDKFVLVAAPIGRGERSQLNIYEQVKGTRPCFAVGEGKPAAVNPLLATFDFSGICGRYIDANGFSVRIGGSDLASTYRLMVTRDTDDMLLLAIPTRGGAGPEMVVARTLGLAGGFLKLELEPGWTLKRRQYGSRRLGHIYLYRDDWPGATAATAAPPADELLIPAAEPLIPSGDGPVELPSDPAPAEGGLPDF
jgi:hypothetical protein